MPRPLLVLCLLAAGCSGKDPYNPGTPIGTFHVTGTLRSDTCGAAGSAPNPWLFDVKLAQDPGVLYWIQGGEPVSGSLDSQLHGVMTTSTTTSVHPADPKTGLGACGLERDDSLDATLSGAPPNAFTGTIVYAFKQTDGSDCSDQLAAAGGTFATLPCSTSYDLAGTLATTK